MVEIGRYSMLAPRVTIIGDDHVTSTVRTPMQFTGRPEQTSTTIGDDVWIGHGALILRGVRVGRGAIVAARAVVTKDVPEYTVVAGMPARHIRNRFPCADDILSHNNALDGPVVKPSFVEPVRAGRNPPTYRRQ